jgi:hypothetical protein
VTNVAAGSVSDYGEVHIPLFIMDYATRPIIRESKCTPPAVSYTAKTDDPTDFANANVQTWFEMAPVFKRVNFIVKTNSFATLTGRTPTADAAAVFPRVPASTDYTPLNSLLLSEYLEPGQFYSLAAYPVEDTAASANVEASKHLRYSWRLDNTVTSVSSGIAANVGTFRIVPLPGITSQALTGVGFSISGSSATFASTFNPAQWIVAKNVGTGTADVAAQTGARSAWFEPVSGEQLSLAPGTYTYSAPQAADACSGTIPAGTFTIQAGKATELFVMGSYACTKQSTALSVVQKTPAAAQLPNADCSVAAPQTAFLIGASSQAAPSLVVLLAAALAAIVAAML